MNLPTLSTSQYIEMAKAMAAIFAAVALFIAWSDTRRPQ